MNRSRTRPNSNGRKEIFQKSPLALRDDFDRSVILIADVSAKPKRTSLPKDKIAESNPLDEPPDRHMKPRFHTI